MIRRSRMYIGGLHDQKEQNVYRGTSWSEGAKCIQGGLHDQKEQNVYSGASWSEGAECIQGGFMIRRSKILIDGSKCLNVWTSVMSESGMIVNMWLVACRSFWCVLMLLRDGCWLHHMCRSVRMFQLVFVSERISVKFCTGDFMKITL